MPSDLDLATKKQIIGSFRRGIYESFNYQCVYCGDRAEPLDHEWFRARSSWTEEREQAIANWLFG